MVNENILCNNYINLNFNNCSNFANDNFRNKKNRQDIDVSTIKKIINNNINDLKQNIKINQNNLNINNNINYLKNGNGKNSVNTNKKKGKISVNKTGMNKYTLYKSSSMKSMGGYNNNYINGKKSPVLVKSNNNKLYKNANKGNKKQNINLKKETKNISINSTNFNSNNYNHNMNSINSSKKQSHRINPLSASNFGNHKTVNMNNHIFNRGKSEFNLKIETNDMNFISLFHQRRKNKLGEKSFVKTSSCDKIIMGNTTSHYNQRHSVNNKSNVNSNNNIGKKTLQKERIKSSINLDKKIVSWLHKNYKNSKAKKFKNNTINKNSSVKVKFSRHDSFLYINNDNYNYGKNNDPIKNKNFPCINSINISNSPIKKIIELNSINLNSRQIKSNRSNFNTINSMNTIAKVQSMKSIYSKHKISKLQRILSQKTTFSGFSHQNNKSSSKLKKVNTKSNSKGMSKMMSAKNLFSDRLDYNQNFNYKPRNLKIDSTSNGYESKNENKQNDANFEYIKSI